MFHKYFFEANERSTLIILYKKFWLTIYRTGFQNLIISIESGAISWFLHQQQTIVLILPYNVAAFTWFDTWFYIWWILLIFMWFSFILSFFQTTSKILYWFLILLDDSFMWFSFILPILEATPKILWILLIGSFTNFRFFLIFSLLQHILFSVCHFI